jgi:hypothetical protein
MQAVYLKAYAPVPGGGSRTGPEPVDFELPEGDVTTLVGEGEYLVTFKNKTQVRVILPMC